MKTIIFILFSTCALVSHVAPNAIHTQMVTEWNSDLEPSSDSTSCGGILTGNDGSITYKPNEYLNPNERCVWVLRGDNVTDYHIALASLGFQPSADHQLTITGLGGMTTDFNMPVHLVPDKLGLYNVHNRTVVIVTLHTGPSMTAIPGFSLQYAASNNGLTHLPSPRSSSFLVNTANGHLKYPETGTYDNWEVTTIAFLPPNNTYSPTFTTEMQFVVNGLQANTDMINIYAYNSTSASEDKWQLFDSIRMTRQPSRPASRFSLALAMLSTMSYF